MLFIFCLKVFIKKNMYLNNKLMNDIEFVYFRFREKGRLGWYFVSFFLFEDLGLELGKINRFWLTKDLKNCLM